jgi:biopolymer transport protein ExbD
LSLPESSQATTEGSSELAPVYVSINQEGQVFLGANSEPVSLESLEAGLRSLVRDNPKVRVALEMDEHGPFGIFIKVTDAIKAAGVKSGLMINTRKKESQ